MTFQYIKGVDEAARILASRLREDLTAGKRVLWLISGGSNLPITVKTMELIRDTEPKNLTLMLTDERFGAVGHADSNAHQLKQAGFVEGKALFIQTLANTTLEDTTRYYAEAIEKAFNHHDVVIGQFGIGDDGHIAGILPHSPAIDAHSAWVVQYEAPPYTRITITPHTISKITAAYTFAFGENKRQTLADLRDKNMPIADQPARLLKMLPEAHICSDQL